MCCSSARDVLAKCLSSNAGIQAYCCMLHLFKFQNNYLEQTLYFCRPAYVPFEKILYLSMMQELANNYRFFHSAFSARYFLSCSLSLSLSLLSLISVDLVVFVCVELILLLKILFFFFLFLSCDGCCRICREIILFGLRKKSPPPPSPPLPKNTSRSLEQDKYQPRIAALQPLPVPLTPAFPFLSVAARRL